MTATRAAPDTTTDPSGISGSAYAARVKAEIDALWNFVSTQTGSVGGTGNAITAVSSPPLIADPVNGQTFRLVPTAGNTGAVTVNLDGRGAIALKDEDGGALASGDLVTNHPIMFWYDSANSYYRLGAPTLADLLSAMAAQVTAATVWEKINSTTISGPTASVEHTFTAGSYTKILVIISGVSPATGVGSAIIATLRNASGAIVTVTSTTLYAAADFMVGQVEFFLDLVNATKQHTGILTSKDETTKASGSSATAPDRIRVIVNGTNMDDGKVFTYGLKV